MIFLEKPTDFASKMIVVSCFLEVAGKILLLHRQNHKPQGNTWGVPAGKVDAGEDVKAAMIREIGEEIGVCLILSDLSLFRSVYVRYPEYDFEYVMHQCKLARRPAITLETKEHKNYRWVTPRKALSMNLIPDEDACIKLVYTIK